MREQMNWLRPLIPSWRFFDRAGDPTRLSVRTRLSHGSFGAWKPVLSRPRRGFLNLFLHPEGNLYLANQGVVDRLVQELEHATDVESLTSFELCRQLAIRAAVNSTTPRPLLILQFRIEVCGRENYEALISREYEI